MISMLLGGLGGIIGVVGWFVYKSVMSLFIGTGLYIIETILEWNALNTNAKIMDIFIFIIGCIVGTFLSSAFYLYGLLAICLYNLIVTIFGLIVLIKIIK